MKVRVASERDLDRVAALASLLFAEHAEHAAFALERGGDDGLRELVASALRDAARALLVAEAGNGNLVGFAAAAVVKRPGPFAERERGALDWLYVRAEARRSGAGRALAEAALAWLRARGVARVEVQVARANASGRAFWRALGFAPTMDVLERPL